MQRTIDSGDPFDLELEIVTAKGNSRIVRALGKRRLFSDKNKIVFGVFQDITERRQAQIALQQSEERFRFIIEQSPLSIQVLDATGKTIKVSKSFEKLWGVKFEDLKDYNILRDQQLERLGLSDDLKKAFTGELVELPSSEYDSNDTLGLGFKRFVKSLAFPIKNEEGRVDIVVLIHEDVTERKTADEALRVAKEVAEQANRTKDLFLATLSHELRTPLTAILSWSQLIRSGRLSAEKSRKGIEVIEQSALAQSRLINDLLDVSRISSGKLVLNCREISPAPVLFEEVSSVTLTASEKQIELISSVDPAVTTVFADPVRLRQILWNLLGNALKFTPRGGKIWIGLRRSGDHVEFTIRDNGSGISPDFLNQIFNRFVQADSSSTREHGGLGLGLAISNSLAKMMGGSLEAKSLGKNLGSTFTVQLPIRAVALQSDTSPKHLLDEGLALSLPTAEELSRVKGLKILCVDDDSRILDAIKMVLESYEIIVRPVLSAKEALDVLSTFSPDLIISDIAMPETDGYSLLKQIKNLSSQKDVQTPVIALTAFAGPEDEMRVREAGFHGYLAKPVDANTLLGVIVNCSLRLGLNSRESTEEAR